MGSLESDMLLAWSVRMSGAAFLMVDASTISRFARSLRKCDSYVHAHVYLLRQSKHVTCIMELGAVNFASPV